MSKPCLVETKVHGTPRTYSNNEREWQAKIAEAVERNRSKQLKPKGKCQCNVSLVFTLNKRRIFRSGCNDVDNLSKPVLDVLFRGKKNLPTAVLCDCDDTRVNVLNVTKMECWNDKDEGVRIIVKPSDSPQD